MENGGRAMVEAAASDLAKQRAKAPRLGAQAGIPPRDEVVAEAVLWPPAAETGPPVVGCSAEDARPIALEGSL